MDRTGWLRVRSGSDLARALGDHLAVGATGLDLRVAIGVGAGTSSVDPAAYGGGHRPVNYDPVAHVVADGQYTQLIRRQCLALRPKSIRIDAVGDIDDFARIDPPLYDRNLAGRDDHCDVDAKAFWIGVERMRAGIFSRTVTGHDQRTSQQLSLVDQKINLAGVEHMQNVGWPKDPGG